MKNKYKYKFLKIFANGKYLCSINTNKYNNIGYINTKLSEEFYDDKPILLIHNNEIVKDEHLLKMIKKGFCKLKIYQV